jgi:hypothetical protein
MVRTGGRGSFSTTNTTISSGQGSQGSAFFGNGYVSGASAPSAWDTTVALFDGIRDWASSSYNSDIWGSGTNSSWSTAFWWRKNGAGVINSGGNFTVIGRWDTTPNPDANVWRFHTRTTGRLTFYMAINPADTGGTYGEVTSPPSDGAWHHYALVYSGSGATNADRMQVYIDGVSQTLTFVGAGGIPTTSSLPATNVDLTVGRGQNIAAFYVASGAFDEIAHFNRNLTSAQVSDIYNAGNPIDIRTISSVSTYLNGYWTMGESHTANLIANAVSGSVMSLLNDSGSQPTGATGSIENRYSTTDLP